jgi:8-oxo-dGTP pyrophosphatase MutT (NUDIX family)
MTEIVDIVNIHNKVTGRNTRDEAHKSGLLHRCVIAELKDKNGNWVFVRQSSAMQDAGQLASAVGGHVKAGEAPLTALKREVSEELGITKFTKFHKGDFIYQRETLGRNENHYFVVYEIHSNEKIILNEESDELVMFSLYELKRNLKDKPELFGDSLLNILHKLYPEYMI